jgi:hypothetical protein
LATESKSRLDKAREVSTGLRRVELASPSGSQKTETGPTTFIKPTLLQTPEYQDVKGSIFVFDSSGKQLIEPFYNLVISGSRYSLADRVSRTATMDGEYRKFLGKAPVRVEFTIGLYDYRNHPWKDQFIYLWNEVFRGTVLQDYKASVYIYCGGDIFVGDLHSCSVARASEADGMIVAAIGMDCNKPPIPFNPAFTAEELGADFSIRRDIINTIEKGVRVSSAVWD